MQINQIYKNQQQLFLFKTAMNNGNKNRCIEIILGLGYLSYESDTCDSDSDSDGWIFVNKVTSDSSDEDIFTYTIEDMITFTTPYHLTLLDLAIHHRKKNIIEYLIDCGAKPTKKGHTIYHLICQRVFKNQRYYESLNNAIKYNKERHYRTFKHHLERP